MGRGDAAKTHWDQLPEMGPGLNKISIKKLASSFLLVIINISVTYKNQVLVPCRA